MTVTCHVLNRYLSYTRNLLINEFEQWDPCIFISIGIGISLNRPVDIFIWILMLLVFVDMENLFKIIIERMQYNISEIIFVSFIVIKNIFRRNSKC